MKLLVLYTNDKDKELYERLLLFDGRYSSLFININSAKKSSLFEYIQTADKIVVFFDKEFFNSNTHIQLEIFDFLFDYKDKTVVVSNGVLPYAVERKLPRILCYNIKDKNDYTSLQKSLKNFLSDIENNKEFHDAKFIFSNDFFKKISSSKGFILFNFVLFFMSYLIGVSFEKGFHNNLIIYIIAWIFFIISITNILYFIYSNFKKLFYSNKEVKDYIKEAADVFVSSEFLDKSDKKNTNALGRMLINIGSLREYYSWSKKQSQMSFYLAVFLIFTGIFIIIGAVVAQIIYNVSITISIVIALNGAIVEFIAGTALVIYKSSLNQLNYYHKVLHEDERFLSSVSMVDALSNDKDKDDMIKELIRSEIELNKLELIPTNYNHDNVKER